MEPSDKLSWIKGFKAGFAAIGATQRGLFSWVATLDDSYVFTAEIDHVEPEDNVYKHKEGLFHKRTPPMSKELGHSAPSLKNSTELLEAITRSHGENLKCRLILVKGNKNGTSSTGIKTAVDNDSWQVTEFSGTVEEGYEFTLKRVP